MILSVGDGAESFGVIPSAKDLNSFASVNVISGPLIVADIESKCYGKYCLTGIIRHWFHLLNS